MPFATVVVLFDEAQETNVRAVMTKIVYKNIFLMFLKIIMNSFKPLCLFSKVKNSMCFMTISLPERSINFRQSFIHISNFGIV